MYIPNPCCLSLGLCRVAGVLRPNFMNLKLDLHDIFSNGYRLEKALTDIMQEAQDKKARCVEIIPGKGSGQLKKYVLRFLEKNYKNIYHRIEKDDKNWGRIFIHFRWER